MAEPAEFEVLDLSEDSRLGLFVVARLAHRQDIRVTLLESAFGGIRAVVLTPAALLVTPSDVPVSGTTNPARPGRPLPPARTPAAAVPTNGVAAVNGRASGGSAVTAIAEPPRVPTVLAGD